MVKIEVGGLGFGGCAGVRGDSCAILPIPMEQLRSMPTSKFEREEAWPMPTLAPYNLRWFESSSIRSTLPCLQRSRPRTRAPSPPEKIYSPHRTLEEGPSWCGGLRPDRNDVIQVDPPHAYGIVQYARTMDMLERDGWSRSALFPRRRPNVSGRREVSDLAGANVPACSALLAGLHDKSQQSLSIT